MLDTVLITCPHCGERFETVVDASAGDAEYIEDCFVCCRPITVRLLTRVRAERPIMLAA